MVIKIGFSYPKKFKIGAWLISWWINRPYSHCYVMIRSESLEMNTVYQAAHGSIHFREYDTKFKNENLVIYEYDIEITPEQRKQILRLCIELAGDDYGYADLPSIFLSDLCRKLGIKALQTHDGPGYVCSALVGKLMIDFLGYKTNIPNHLLKPNDIENMVLYGKDETNTINSN